MHRSLALVTAASAAAFSLGACGPGTTEGESAMPDETRSPTPDTASSTDAETNTPASFAPTTEGVPETAPAASSEPAVTSEVEPVPSDTSVGDDDTDGPLSTPDRLGLLAATDLADRLDIAVEDVEIVEVEEVTWSDASLGCPQKDFQYPQVLTPGVRIALSARGSTYAYHAGSGRDPFYCVDPQTPA